MKLLIKQTLLQPIPPGLGSLGNVGFPSRGMAEAPLSQVLAALAGQTLLGTLPRNVGFCSVWQRNLSVMTPEIPLGIGNCPFFQQLGVAAGRERKGGTDSKRGAENSR